MTKKPGGQKERQPADVYTAAIEAVLRKLPVKEGVDERVKVTASALAGLAAAGQQEVPNRFRQIPTAAARAELMTLQQKVHDLIRRVDALHMPSIIALADTGYLLDDFRCHLIAFLETAINAAAAVNCDEKRRREPDHLVHGVAGYLAQEYAYLTGEPPSVATNANDGHAYGPFLKFCAEILKAMEIKASPEVVAREAAAKYRNREARAPERELRDADTASRMLQWWNGLSDEERTAQPFAGEFVKRN